MVSQELCKRIDEVFGKYKRPKHISGEPREDWQDLVEQRNLGSISEEGLELAMYHLFPGHYGDLDVFRYVLKRALHQCFCADREWEEPSMDDLLEVTCRNCCRWKVQLTQDERDLLECVFQDAWRQHYASTEQLSSFYFNLLMVWTCMIPEYDKILGCSPKGDREFRERIANVLFAYRWPKLVSPCRALLGIYDSERRANMNRSLVFDWVGDALTFGDWDVPGVLDLHEISRLDDLLRKEFVQEA